MPTFSALSVAVEKLATNAYLLSYFTYLLVDILFLNPDCERVSKGDAVPIVASVQNNAVL